MMLTNYHQAMYVHLFNLLLAASYLALSTQYSSLRYANHPRD